MDRAVDCPAENRRLHARQSAPASRPCRGGRRVLFSTPRGLPGPRVEIRDGSITAIRKADAGSAIRDTIDCRGGIAFPAFVDCHTHIDKGHIWARSPNPDGSFPPGALGAVGADRRANWSADDVARRMEFSLSCAYAHGTKALRTHLDSCPRRRIFPGRCFRRSGSAGEVVSSSRPPACSGSTRPAMKPGSTGWRALSLITGAFSGQ